MGRRKKQEDEAIGCAILLGIGIFFYLWNSYGNVVWITFGAIVVLIIVGLIAKAIAEEKRVRALELADVDNMSGTEFEHYVGRLLAHQGFGIKVTKASGDFGVDIVAKKDGATYAIQVKRYSNSVSRRAVSDAVAGKEHYACNGAMVVTNNYFTKGAITLAQSTKCDLVDRDTLAKWILDFQAPNTTRKIAQSTTSSKTRLFTSNQWLVLSLLGVGFIGVYGCLICALILQ